MYTPISSFKAHCLDIINKLDELPEKEVIITKRGTPVAKLTPIRSSIIVNEERIPDKLKDCIILSEDIITPLGEKLWDVCK